MRNLLPISFIFISFTLFNNDLTAQTYVQSGQCMICHPEHFTDWESTGHPYKFTIVQNNMPPEYPMEAINFQDEWMDSLGDGSHTWEDIAGVIGGYGWKTRFVGTDGHIIGTAGSSFDDAGGGHNQINFFGGENHGWVNYNAGNVKIYNYSCFKCHTTGGDTTGTWLAGVEGLGTFSEGGIGCEACHGPGSDHIASPTKDNIDLVYEQVHLDNSIGGLSIDGVVQTPDPDGNDVNFMCGTCHNRSYTDPINASGGFIRHHEQWDEFVATRHDDLGFNCTTCHDPHKRTIWDGDGIKRTCESCHTDHMANTNHTASATCIDCHMPFASKSGTAIGASGYRGDVRSHLLKIIPDTASMFTVDGKNVRDDDIRPASLSPAFACLGCHNDDPNDNIPDQTLEYAAFAAKNMHQPMEYVTSERCQGCHTDHFNDWADSGHPYKFTIVENGMEPSYPPEAVNFQDEWMDSLGDGSHTWEDIAGVIGGYGWKTRFVGTDGHIIGTAGSSFDDAGGGHNQINFFGGENHGWVNYNASNVKIYNYSCFKCHTTGGDTTGTWLAGVEGLGTFSEGGIGCESCHGPGGEHIKDPTKENIDLVYEQVHQDNSLGGLSIDGVVQTPNSNGDDINFMCGTCHNRSYTDPINASGGFIRHHEQWDEFVATPHGDVGFTCVTCHDPHKRTIWDGDGITRTCESCHPDHMAQVNHTPSATCIDCHMPFAAKSGTAIGASGFRGDVRSHLVVITPDTASMFTADGKNVRDDEMRPASLSPAFSCLGCHNDDPNDNIPDQTLEYAVAAAKNMHVKMDYVTSQRCQGCHTDHYNDWAASGHPYKFTIVENGVEPTYPPEAINFQDEWMDSLGDGSHTWEDIAGVIGGYGWKTRFVGTDGHIIGTAGSSFDDAGGGHNQINFFGGENHGWVNYNASNVKIYNYSCFKCHTTGGDTTGTWLAGIEGLGTFSEGGIGCESCHGPGGDHISDPTKDNIDLVYEQLHLDNTVGGLSIDGVVQAPNPDGDDVNFMCGSCHNRSYTDPINSSGGFIRHHEQWDEFVATSHYELEMSCSTCHDPHKRTIWDGDGITRTCEACHAEQAEELAHSPGLDCIDCHMPYAAKSGTKIGQSGYRGDVRSHLMKITPDTASMFTEDGSAVRDDDMRKASLSPGFSCLGCHNDDPNDDIPDKTLADAAMLARNIHGTSTSVDDIISDNISFKIYPNPAVNEVNIEFTLNRTQAVLLNIFDPSGKLIYSSTLNNTHSGINKFTWNALSNENQHLTSGVYFVTLRTTKDAMTKKLILLR
ncbi:MAG: T9SS type A sorting domain-containing protein [Saprospiraceae bacterium]|nr:T9SS type A sorting domain-containing protein [Saprospiraceae bacterium]